MSEGEEWEDAAREWLKERDHRRRQAMLVNDPVATAAYERGRANERERCLKIARLHREWIERFLPLALDESFRQRALGAVEAISGLGMAIEKAVPGRVVAGQTGRGGS